MTLEPVKIGSTLLQKADLTIGDFFGCWWRIRSGLGKIYTDLSKTVVHQSMTKKQKKLLYNDLFASGTYLNFALLIFLFIQLFHISAIYLDPRFQQLLAPSMKIRAIMHLNKLWLLLQRLKNRGMAIDGSTVIDLEEKEIVVISNDNQSVVEDEFEIFLSAKCGPQVSNRNEIQSIDIHSIISLFDGVERISHNSNIRDYWISKKAVNPELYELSQIL